MSLAWKPRVRYSPIGPYDLVVWAAISVVMAGCVFALLRIFL